MKNIFKGLQRLSLLCAPILAGCTDTHGEDALPAGPALNNVLITVTIPGTQAPTTRSIADGDGEAAVGSVDVLVFGPGAAPGTPDVLLEHAPGTNIDQNTGSSTNYEVRFRANLTTDASATSVAILANVPAATVSAISLLTYKNDILEALTYASVNPPGTADGWKWNTGGPSNHDPIPMYGEQVLPGGGIAAGMNVTGIPLTRMVARIDVVNDAGPGFNLLKVLVVNYNTAGYIAPAWNANGTLPGILPSNPMIPPTANPQVGTANAMQYTYAGYNSGTGMYGEIYTYEAAATTGKDGTAGHTGAACLVIEGEYPAGAGKTYFYRVDFTSGEDATGKSPGAPGFDPSTVAYMPLYRNHRYTVSIVKAEGIGYDSVDEALKSLGVMNNLKTGLLVVDESGITSTVFNGQYYLGTGDAVVLETAAGSTSTVKCTTNYVDGWTIDDPAWPDGIEYSSGEPGWLKAEKDPLAASNKTANLMLETIDANSTGAEREAYVHIKAGRLRHKVRVTQPNQSEEATYSGFFGGELKQDANGVWQFEQRLYVRDTDGPVTLRWQYPASATKVIDDTRGKLNTFTLRNLDPGNNYEAANLCFRENDNHSSITAVTDANYVWYLPAHKQLLAIWVVNNSLDAHYLNGEYYWSSTEYSTTLAWCTHFQTGYTYRRGKTIRYSVRCVRE